MSVTLDPITWALLKNGQPIDPEPLKGGETPVIAQPKDRAGVIAVSKGALKTIRTFSQYALADRRYHGTVRDVAENYRKLPRSATLARRDRTAHKPNYKLPNRSYVPKTVILEDQPVLNVFDVTMPYLASAKDDLNPTPFLTIEEGIPDSWQRPARVSRMHALKSERHDWHKQVSKGLDAIVPYRDHVHDKKAHRKKVTTQGIATDRGQAYVDLLKQGGQYSGVPHVRPTIEPVRVP